MHFTSGKNTKNNETKYLGCLMNDKGDPIREINRRKAECYLTWKSLETFWKDSNCDVITKIRAYDAVIRTKLMYGLESVQVNDTQKKSIDAFQLKGLRQILKIQTTYGQMESDLDRTNSNEHVFKLANSFC